MGQNEEDKHLDPAVLKIVNILHKKIKKPPKLDIIEYNKN